MSWINLLDVIYPVGSLYFSTASGSPASSVGGTWTQVKGATIAAVGSNNVTVANYNGSLKISVEQMPSHKHNLIYCNRDNYTTTASSNVNAFDISVNHWQDDKLSVTSQVESAGITFSDGSSVYTGGGARLHALQLWSLYLVQNGVAVHAKLQSSLVGGYNG